MQSQHYHQQQQQKHRSKCCSVLKNNKIREVNCVPQQNV